MTHPIKNKKESSKVFLVNLSMGNVIWGGEPKIPKHHLGLLSIAEYLKSKGEEGIFVLDGDASEISDREILNILLNEKPKIVGFSPYQNSFNRAINIIKKFRKKIKESYVILGGQHVSFFPKEILEDHLEVDFILIGEAEKSLLELLKLFSNGRDLKKIDIPGIVYRCGNNIVNTGKPSILDSDSLPKLGPIQAVENSEIALMSSRGCQSNCKFCVSPNFASLSKYRARTQSADYAFDQILELSKLFGERKFSIHFHDPDFVGLGEYRKKRSERIAELIVKSNINAEFRFACQALCAKWADRKFWNLWRRAGLSKVYIGFESDRNEESNELNKSSYFRHNLEVYRLIKSCGISVQAGFIMFNPHSNVESIFENINFLAKLDQLHIFRHVASSLYVYPGTKNFDRFNELGLLEYEKPYKDIKLKYTDPRIEKIKNLLTKNFISSQYKIDQLLLDIEFAFSAGSPSIKFDEKFIELTKSNINKFHKFRESRSNLVHDYLTYILRSDVEEIDYLSEGFNSKLNKEAQKFIKVLQKPK